MKNNYTNELMKNNDTFALSVIGKDTNPEIIKKRYKTRNGILSYLYYQMVDWTDKKEKDGLSL